MYRWFLTFICFLAGITTFGQVNIIEDPYLKFDHLDVKSGLSSNNIRQILQDKEGYIWIATLNGLNRFDGFTCETFLHSPIDSSSLSSSIISCLELDLEGNLWIGTQNGLNRFDNVSQTFINFKNSTDSLYINNSDFIRAILADSNHILWIENALGKLKKVNTRNGQQKSFEHVPPSQVNTYFYHDIQKDKDGSLWLGGRYMGVIKFSAKNESFEIIRSDPDDPTKKRDDDVAVYFTDTKGIFWVGGIDGLYTFNRKENSFAKVLSISTFSIQEDNKGNLWIGTGSGLFRLNESRTELKHFAHADNNSKSICHDHINNLFIDRTGNIWIGTLDGISIYRPSKNKFGQLYHVPENNNTPVSNHITCILEDSKHRIWIGTSSEGLECFDQNLDKIHQYNTKSNFPFQLVSDKISALMEDDEGDIWVGLWSGRGFQILNPDTKTNKHYQLHEGSLKADWYNDFMQDTKGNFWIGIWGGQGLYTFDKKAGKFTNDRFNFLYHTYNQPVLSIAHDGQYVWPVLSNQERFFCLDPVSSKYSFYSNDYYFPFDFSKIYNAVSDKKGKVWFSTDNGIYVKTNDPYFSFTRTTEDFIPPQKQIDKSTVMNIIGKEVLSCIQDEYGNKWAGTYEGLYKIEDHKIEKIYRSSVTNDSFLISDTVLWLDYNSPGELWIGTARGICLLDIMNNKFTSYNYNKNLYLSSHLISFIFEDSQGYIWIGTTENGLNKLDPKTGMIEQFLDNPADSLSFWGLNASCTVEDRQGFLWIGGMGLNKFDPEFETFTHYTESNGLSNNDIKAIQIDNSDILWISTANGLSRFNPDSGIFINYFEKDGLQDNEFSRASYKLSNGSLLFGGKNGINLFMPDDIQKNAIPPEIKLTGFNIFDKDKSTLLKSEDGIKLTYDQNYISFEFVALDYSNPEENNYAYKLEDFDENWIYTSASNRIARYTNVDPGHYTFCVKGANSDGVWNETGIRLPVIIKPPFWKTLWFYTLEFLMVVLGIFIFIKYRERKMREQNFYLQLEQKLLRSQMNPHFIFNSLSSIQSFIFESDPIKAGSYLSRFAELIRAILYNSREEYVLLEKEIKTLQNYLDLQQLRYNNSFEYDIDVDPLIDPEEILIPPMLAQPFIENSIEHGIKYIKIKGLISISFTFMNDSILFIIEDNGIGIQAAKKLKDNKSKEHTSLATVITRERIDIFNKGNKRKPFTMNVSEMKDIHGNVVGTKVKLIIPFVQT